VTRAIVISIMLTLAAELQPNTVLDANTLSNQIVGIIEFRGGASALLLRLRPRKLATLPLA